MPLGPNQGLLGRGPHPPFRSRKGFRYVNTVSVSAYPEPSNEGGYIEIRAANIGGDHNEVWRFTSTTSPIQLTATLAMGVPFRDYAVASGVTYFYFVRSVNADATFQDSTPAASTVDLQTTWIHVAAKNSASNINATYGALSLSLLVPVSRPSVRDTKELIEPGRTKAVVATGDIVDRAFIGTLIFSGFPNSTFTAFQAMYEARRVMCVRDMKGHILFGTMTKFMTTYQHSLIQVELVVEESDFYEDLAAA